MSLKSQLYNIYIYNDFSLEFGKTFKVHNFFLSADDISLYKNEHFFLFGSKTIFGFFGMFQKKFQEASEALPTQMKAKIIEEKF